MSHSNFNSVSKVYDWLSKLVFGGDIKRSQTVFLNYINEGDNILIIGGGTGWILEEIGKIEKTVSIVYVEPSSEMMTRSRQRMLSKKLKVQFVEKTLLDFQDPQKFDVVCTFYFLDLFQEKELLETIERITVQLKESGKWLFADFFLDGKSPWSHKLLVKLMFVFFGIVSNIQSSKLFDFQSLIMNLGFSKGQHSILKNGLIQSSVFYKV